MPLLPLNKFEIHKSRWIECWKEEEDINVKDDLSKSFCYYLCNQWIRWIIGHVILNCIYYYCHAKIYKFLLCIINLSNFNHFFIIFIKWKLIVFETTPALISQPPPTNLHKSVVLGHVRECVEKVNRTRRRRVDWELRSHTESKVERKRLRWRQGRQVHGAALARTACGVV